MIPRIAFTPVSSIVDTLYRSDKPSASWAAGIPPSHPSTPQTRRSLPGAPTERSPGGRRRKQLERRSIEPVKEDEAPDMRKESHTPTRGNVRANFDGYVTPSSSPSKSRLPIPRQSSAFS
ncbi:hypothetical protein BDY19DRAFT_709672 [Irpex rosettiformis]|uniref:Uncharacterized protein n=1 Tax=Irpex rosettiformis TaxID=378272 RepID=A0ACB8TMP4_9APHY|nr:hypothetical protein BDY19DRAFT_709672 [Irpex rosettiformis]